MKPKITLLRLYSLSVRKSLTLSVLKAQMGMAYLNLIGHNYGNQRRCDSAVRISNFNEFVTS